MVDDDDDDGDDGDKIIMGYFGIVHDGLLAG